MKKVKVSFDSMWVLSRRSDAVLPVQAFVNELRKTYTVEVTTSSLTACDIVIKNDVTAEEITKTIAAAMQTLFAIALDSGKVTCTIQEDGDTASPKSETPNWAALEASLAEAIEDGAEEIPDIVVGADLDEMMAKVPTIPEKGALESVMERIGALVGAEEFKKLASEFVSVAPGLIRHGAQETLLRQCYLFAINDGYGTSTYLSLLSDLLEALGLFEFHSKRRVLEVPLLPPQERPDVDPFAPARDLLARDGKGSLICFDIREWMSKTGEKAFRNFLSLVDAQSGKNIVVFRVPFVEKEVLNGIKNTIGDRLFVREVAVVPFDHAELLECARKSLEKRGFTAEEDAWSVVSARINEEKSDGRFYGINTLEKVVCEMIYRKQLDNAVSGVDDTVIKRAEIVGLAASCEGDCKSGLSLLDDFIGMETVKERVAEIVAQIEAATKNKKLGAPCVHMRFVGNPGTGKTTVARVVGRILKEKGILRNGNFFEYAGRDFCGRYVGETAPKTAAMCRDAYGSVLFIDEAYSLYRHDGMSGGDYGREAIDTLIAEMENHRSDLVVIMAGYPDEMKTLMKANAGLESRMPYLVEFPNYTREQLFEIFMKMARKSFTCTDEFEAAAKAYFDSLSDELLDSKEFSNARFVRNLFERTWAKAVLRAQLGKEDGTVLTKEDFLLASGEKEFSKIMKKQIRTLGFV